MGRGMGAPVGGMPMLPLPPGMMQMIGMRAAMAGHGGAAVLMPHMMGQVLPLLMPQNGRVKLQGIMHGVVWLVCMHAKL